MNGPGMSGPAPVSARLIGAATALALAAAGLLLVAFVLPAEYGMDPLGTGRATGLLALAQPEPSALDEAEAPYVAEVVTFHLQPFESVEYKYRLESGAGLVFEWRATGEVLAELHAEPDAAPEGFAESFDKRRADAAQGSYRAPFPGWHGWFWENRGVDAVEVTLDAAGFFRAARTYGGGRVLEERKGPALSSTR